MRVYCCQMDVAWEDKQANLNKAWSLASAAAPEPGSLFILPEMFNTGFSMNSAAICEPPGGETERFAGNLAKELGIYVMAGLAVADGEPRNECVVFAAGGELVCRYAKIQPFSPGGESANYSAGDSLAIFPWQGIHVSPFVCYDLRFPEIFRPIGRKGVELITVIASWPMARASHWVTLLQARAIENQCFVAGVNRCGTDPYFEYPGRSLIVDPLGRILADAGDSEGVVSAELDIEQLLSYRADKPFLADIRPDFVREVA